MSWYRFGKYGVPLSLFIYLLIIGLRLVIGAPELFPFFAWTLFSHTPEWHVDEYAVIVHSMDGEQADANRPLIPNRSIHGWKALLKTVGACRSSPEDCNDNVRQILYPVVRRLTNGSRVEFSIVVLRVNLRDVRDDIRRLANSTSSKSDYYTPERTIGRWTIREDPGRPRLAR